MDQTLTSILMCISEYYNMPPLAAFLYMFQTHMYADTSLHCLDGMFIAIGISLATRARAFVVSAFMYLKIITHCQVQVRKSMLESVT